MISTEKQIKILLIAGIAGCIFFIWYKVTFAAWQDPAQDPPLENRAAPLYSQSAPQKGPLNIKELGTSGAGKIEAEEICICSDNNCLSSSCRTGWSGGLWTKAAAGDNIYYNSGRVGIGVGDPSEILEIAAGSGDTARLRITDLDINENAELQLQYGVNANEHWAIYNKQDNDSFRIWGSGADRIIILQNGNVGIGIDNPASKLEVNGDFTVRGKLNVGSGADLAEEFSTKEELEIGTVVVIGDNGYKSVKPCEKKYDKKVIGVVSSDPAMIMGKISSLHKAIVAMVGIIKVKVTGEVEKGDLLTTSEIKGYAMKAKKGNEGAIIGKALEDFYGGSGKIMAYVNLQ